MIKAKYSTAITDACVRWWELAPNCIAAYQPKGADDYEASKVNLANPGLYNAEDGSTVPTWNAGTGWDFINNATPAHLWTGILAQNDNNMSMICRFDDSTESGNVYIAGSFNTAGGESLGIQFSNRISTKMRIRNGGYKDGGTNQESGVIAVCGRTGFFNASSVVTGLANWSAGSGIEIAIGGINYRSGDGREFYGLAAFDGRIQAFALYSSDISAYISSLTNAMNAL